VDILSGQNTREPTAADWDEAVALLRVSADDRSSPMPLLALVSTRLKGMIESGRMPQGSRIENEVALAEKIGISRPTMRRALQELVDKGYLLRKPGVGPACAVRSSSPACMTIWRLRCGSRRAATSRRSGGCGTRTRNRSP
jgi:Bacterial regulatory proteins, gntR family